MLNILNSARLSYSLLNASDGELLFELDQDPEVMQYINGGTPTSRADVDAVSIPRMMSYRNPAKGWGIWKVTVTATDQYIGWVLVRPMHFFSDVPAWDNLELGWRFHRHSWGKGYASEAAHKIADTFAAFSEVKILSAIAVPENAGSIAVMNKIGMSFVKSYVHKDPLFEEEVVLYEREI